MTEGGPISSLDSLQPALRELFARDSVALAYVYGSQARSDAGPLSDVDVAVLFQPEMPPSEHNDRLLHLIGELMSVFKRFQRYYLLQSIADGTFGHARTAVAEDKKPYG
ncbi:MAG: nucleotidyltransferase family protein [Anaerolineae bacterium]